MKKSTKNDKKSTINLNNSPSLFLLDNETPLGDESVDETLRTYSGGVSGLKVISENKKKP
jgi:hypothetical protein